MSKPSCTIAVLGDHQIPFEDRRALRHVHDYLDSVQPDRIILNGDVADCYAISKYDKNPSRRLLFSQERKKVVRYLRDLRNRYPNSAIDYLGGNHEDRLRRFLWSKASCLADLGELTIPELFNLEELDISWYDQSEIRCYSGLWIHHGTVVRKNAGGSVLAMMGKTGGHTLVNHCHRIAHIMQTTWTGVRNGWENGCLCQLTPEYGDARPNWQQGFSIVRYYGERNFVVTQYPLVDRRGWQ